MLQASARWGILEIAFASPFFFSVYRKNTALYSLSPSCFVFYPVPYQVYVFDLSHKNCESFTLYVNDFLVAYAKEA